MCVRVQLLIEAQIEFTTINAELFLDSELSTTRISMLCKAEKCVASVCVHVCLCVCVFVRFDGSISIYANIPSK